MSSRQAFFVLIGVICLIIGLAGFMTHQVGAILTNKGDELVEKKLQSQVLSEREQALLQAKSDIQRYTELEQIAKAIVPQEKDQARTVREINTIAQQTGVSIASFRFPASALGDVQRGRQTKQTANPETSQLTPVDGTAGLYAMEITVQSSNTPVSYNNVLAFLEGLEKNRRTAHVTNLSISPSQDNRTLVTFSVTLNVYIKP